jgi:hypothetical protein
MDDVRLDDERVEALIEYFKQHRAFPEMPVGRMAGNRLQLAYGHHVVEAARQLELTELQVDVRELDDIHMITLMPTHSRSPRQARHTVVYTVVDECAQLRAT